MAKQLNVSLAFQADTSQAKTQIQGLVNELNKLSSIGAQSVGTEKLTSEIIEAKMAAKDLGVILEQSFNVDTGKLDLNKFNSTLKKSGMSLTDYGNKMAMLGTQGDQAFLKIAQSIVETEAPLRRSTGLLKGFGTTLANTARWQISSSILHGFMGSVQKAYGYAQDLNESLNNIRIVTGQNIDQMTVFAERANKAAKALSTTTTDYTNASLIYYQQGLSDSEVQERTDITVKMANAAGQSAEVVSDQLTAVWNNFDNGTKSLEHYADVMTALGAATASSTDEIADGLEKFAAVADTVGLSYEYAASALATVTATTRQSADVVGTAFKTLFARIEGLKLGETLDDGTTLNQYSEALMAVGVNIKDSNGELKNMDTILTEMAAKWETLNKDEQVALAQKVAGVRQYTQLIALMDNWDFMEENLSTSANAAGTLDEQQKIYEESWAASQDRVKASMEGVFDSLINEDFFIGLNDTLSSALGTIEKLIDAIGGMPGVLSIVGVLITSIFKDELSNGINNALHNFKNFTGASKAELEGLRKEAYNYARSMTEGLAGTPGSEMIEAQRKHLERTYEMQKQLESAIIGTSSAQEKAIRGAHQIAENYSKAAFEAAKFANEAKKSSEKSQKNFSDRFGANFSRDIKETINDANANSTGRDLKNQAAYISKQAKSLDDADVNARAKELDRLIELYDKGKINSEKLIRGMGEVEKAVDQATEPMRVFEEEVVKIAEDMSDFQTKIENLQSETKGFDILDNSDESKQTFQEFENKLTEIKSKLEDLDIDPSSYDDVISKFEKLKTVSDPTEKKRLWDEFVKTLDSLGLEAEEAEQKVQDLAEKATIDKIEGTVSKEDGESEKDYETRRRAKRSGVKSELKRQEKETKSLTAAVYEGAKAQKSAASVDELAKKKKEQLTKAMEKAKKSTQDFGQGVTQMMRGISSFSMGLTSLTSAWNALKDPDMSAWDKFTSIMMSMSMGIPSLVSGFGSIGKGFKEMQGALGGSTTALLANALGLDANALAQTKLNKETLESVGLKGLAESKTTEETLSTIRLVAAKVLEAEAQEEVNEEKKKDSALSLGNIALKKMETMALAGGTAAKIADKGATIAATLVQHGFNASLAPFIGLMLAAVAAMLPYIAAAAALVAVIGLIVYAATAESRALDEAKNKYNESAKAAKEAEEAYHKLNEEATAFSNAVKGYDEAVTKLYSLSKGAEDYAESLELANKKARELIELYGLWNQGVDWDYNSEGLIEFKPNVLSNIQKDKDQKAQDAETYMYATDLIANTNKIDYEKLQTKSDIGSDVKDMETFSITIPAFGYSAPGSELVLDLFSYEGTRDFSGVEIEQIVGVLSEFENLENMKPEALKAALENSGQLSEVLKNNINAIIENKDAFIELTKSIEKTTAANEYATKEMVGNMIEDKYGESYLAAADNDQGLYQNMVSAAGSFASSLTNSAGQTIEEALAEINVSKITSNSELNKLGFDVKDDKDLAKTYAEKVLGWSGSDFSYSKGNGEGTLTNATSGEEMTLDDDFMRQALAKQMKINEVISQFETEYGTQLGNFNKAINHMVSTTSEVTANILLDAVQSEDKKINFQDFMAEISPEELGEYSGLTQEQLLQKLQINPTDLQNLGLGSAEEFMAGFSQAMQNYSPEEFYKNMEQKASATIQAGAAELEMSEASLEAYTENLMKNNSELANNKALAAELAVESARFSIGLDKLDKAMADNSETIRNAEEDSLDYYEAIGAVQEALEETFGVDVDADFIKDNLELIEKAAEGDVEAVNALRKALSQDILCTVMAVDNFSDIDPKIQELSNKLADLSVSEISIGAKLEGEDNFLKTAQGLVDIAGMTVEEAQQYFNALGYEPEFVTEEKIIKQSIPQTQTHTDYKITQGTIDILGAELPIPTIDRIESSRTLGYKEVDQAIQVPAISNGTPQIKSLTKTGGGAPLKSNKDGGDSGGKSSSSSKPKKAEKKKKNEVVERFKEITDQLDDLKDAQDKASKSADRLYGKDKINAMKNVNNMLEQEIGLLKQKQKEAKSYLSQDKADLDALGYNLQYDKAGNVLNQTQVLGALVDEYNALVDSINVDGDVSDEEQEKLDAAEKKIETFKETLNQYEETRELLEDLDNEIQDKIYEIQDNNAEILNYELEIRISVYDNELKKIDYYLSKWENDIDRMADSLKIVFGYGTTKDTLGDGGSLGMYIRQLKDYAAFKEKADQMLKDGQISDEAHAEMLQTAIDGIYDNLTRVQESIKLLETVYQDSLARVGEEIGEEVEKFDQLNNVLDHYQNLMTLMGKEEDHKKIARIYEGQANNAFNRMETAKKEMEMYGNLIKDLNGKITNDMTEEQKKIIQDQIAATEKMYADAQDRMYSAAEEGLENFKQAILEQIKDASKKFEEALLGQGNSFNKMTTAMERMKSVQEEFLTTTNKIYETNKLMRNAQKEIDKTSNSIAKNRLKGFIEETKSKQNQNRLSKFELEIQQAKYNLLVAQIALEEAQNTKSKVRLKRDSAGNFGYVYTADNDEIASAQQDLEDAQNAYYNKSLEGANNYAEKYFTTLQEMYDKLKELAEQKANGMFQTEEEYNAAVLEAKEYYYEILTQYSDLYGYALEQDVNASKEHILGTGDETEKELSADFRSIANEWKDQMEEIISKTEEAFDPNYGAVTNYIKNITSLCETLDEKFKTINEKAFPELGKELSTLEGAVEDVEEETGALAKTIDEKLIPQLEDEMKKVANTAAEYLKLLPILEEVRKKHESLVQEFERDLQEKAGVDIPETAVVGDGQSSGNGTGSFGSGNSSSGNGSKSNKNGLGNFLSDMVEGVGNLIGGAAAMAVTFYALGQASQKDNEITLGEKVYVEGGTTIYTSSNLSTRDHFLSGNGFLKVKQYNERANAVLLEDAYGRQVGWFNKKDISSYDTGGYTGDWAGSYGKLAMLHKKELILNEGDTKNFLASMNLLDKILQTIDLQAANSQYVGNLLTPKVKSPNDILEQNVHIEANFPNATNKNEIEEAFKDIVNLASQYANRR